MVSDLVGRLGQGEDLGEFHESGADGEAHALILPYFPSLWVEPAGLRDPHAID